ncbi:MAG: aldolase/citrate lyase family protein, partial [Burkholderiaceae bacterium]
RRCADQGVGADRAPEAIENLDRILSVPGLGGAIAAPLDLAANMGLAGQPGHARVQEAVAHVRKRIAAHGFPLITFAVTPEQGRAAMAQRADTLFLGFDTMFVPAALNAYLEALLKPAQ